MIEQLVLLRRMVNLNSIIKLNSIWIVDMSHLSKHVRFELHEQFSSLERLSFYLPNKQNIIFNANERIELVISIIDIEKKKLLE